MTAIALFYQLTRAGLDETVNMILIRAMAQGWRVMVRAPDVGLLAHLDDMLWLGPEDGFLPHGVAGGSKDGEQPVLLGAGGIGNEAQGLMLLAGAEVVEAELVGLERVWLLFDGADGEAVEAARGQWRLLTSWGLAAQYWSDETGTWAKKMDKAAVTKE